VVLVGYFECLRGEGVVGTRPMARQSQMQFCGEVGVGIAGIDFHAETRYLDEELFCQVLARVVMIAPEVVVEAEAGHHLVADREASFQDLTDLVQAANWTRSQVTTIGLVDSKTRADPFELAAAVFAEEEE
jgi:hypothetical protein